MWKQIPCAAILITASFGVWAASGNADSYPNKPIRAIVGFSGGGDEYLARAVGPRLTQRFGQTVIVDNRPGAAGTIAAEITARVIKEARITAN